MGQGLCLENLKIMIYITVSSVVLILFIQSLHRKLPVVSLQEFYVPTLNQTAAGNTTISFDLKLDNKNVVGLYFRPMNLTFSFKTTNGSVPIGVYTVRGFFLGHHKEKHFRHTVVTSEVMVHNDGGRVVVIRVDLVGRIKFRSIAQWKRTLVVGGEVEVDEYTGEKVQKSGINLVRNGAAPGAVVVGWICPAVAVAMLLVFSSHFNLGFL